MTERADARGPDGTGRIIDLDVTRAVALIGVCLMNYYGYLVIRGSVRGSGFWGRLFDPWTGPLATRFAATFVTVAGMGIALMARRSLAAADPSAIRRVRWVLVRRGVLLYLFGYVFNWVWPGTILFFYGAFFVAGALLFTLRDRWLVMIGAGAAAAGACLQWWADARRAAGHDPTWLTRPDAGATRSPWDLVVDTFVRGTHPLLPWLLFLCAGIVLGRRLPFDAMLRVRLVFFGVLCTSAGYMLHATGPWAHRTASLVPSERGILYSLTTVGIAVTAVAAIGGIASARADGTFTRMLADTGRFTLTAYVFHAMVFLLLIDRLGWPASGAGHDGLNTALVLAVAYWGTAITIASLWLTRWRLGPLEWFYRRFSDGG